MESKFGDSIEKIYYFSDESAVLKLKKNTNLCLHKNDFNIDAEWHFSAAAHVKGRVTVLVKQWKGYLPERVCDALMIIKFRHQFSCMSG